MDCALTTSTCYPMGGFTSKVIKKHLLNKSWVQEGAGNRQGPCPPGVHHLVVKRRSSLATMMQSRKANWRRQHRNQKHPEPGKPASAVSSRSYQHFDISTAGRGGEEEEEWEW